MRSAQAGARLLRGALARGSDSPRSPVSPARAGDAGNKRVHQRPFQGSSILRLQPRAAQKTAPPWANMCRPSSLTEPQAEAFCAARGLLPQAKRCPVHFPRKRVARPVQSGDAKRVWPLTVTIRALRKRRFACGSVPLGDPIDCAKSPRSHWLRARVCRTTLPAVSSVDPDSKSEGDAQENNSAGAGRQVTKDSPIHWVLSLRALQNKTALYLSRFQPNQIKEKTETERTRHPELQNSERRTPNIFSVPASSSYCGKTLISCNVVCW